MGSPFVHRRMHGAARDGATTRRAARSMGVSFTMDALAAMSSDEEEEEEEDEEEEDANARERSVVVRKRREIDYEALERGGFRARALVDGARDDVGRRRVAEHLRRARRRRRERRTDDVGERNRGRAMRGVHRGGVRGDETSGG